MLATHTRDAALDVDSESMLSALFGHTICGPYSHSHIKACLYFFLISWGLITLQYCSGFCHTLKWISHGFTCVPHPDPTSHLPFHPISLGLPSAPGRSTCLMHPTCILSRVKQITSPGRPVFKTLLHCTHLLILVAHKPHLLLKMTLIPLFSIASETMGIINKMTL